MNKRYAGHRTALVYADVDGKRGEKKVEELLWGDALDLQDETDGKYLRVQVRTGSGSQRIFGWMKSEDLQASPLLELTFIDIGQGDGCVMITPDRRIVVIDAGKRDNMMRYLRWRLMFPSAKRPRKLHAAVISHPDDDHYKGFKPIFKMPGVTFETVYHNGLVERKGASSLGPKTEGSPALYTDLVKNMDQLRERLAADAKIAGKKVYPDMLREALEAGSFEGFQMLSRDDGFMPGFEESEDLAIQVLGPVVETDKQGHVGLRRLGSPGVTKNGHSVVLRLRYGNVRVLLGGDLNIPSEKLLLETWLGRELPEQEEERAAFIKEARALFEVDVAKSCHHGSADFSSLFLEAVHPIATVISSGDSEAHSHPRAETLGAIGVCSRGERPLIFSTELARSAKDAVQDPRKERRKLKALHAKVLAETDKKKARELDRKFRQLVDSMIQQSVQTYGAIYLRTDGTRAVIGQKFEQNRPGKMWDVYELNPDSGGRLVFKSEHAEH